MARLKAVEVGCIILLCCHPDTVDSGNVSFNTSTAVPILGVSVVTPVAGWLQLFVSRDDAADLLNNSPFFEEYVKTAPPKPVKLAVEDVKEEGAPAEGTVKEEGAGAME